MARGMPWGSDKKMTAINLIDFMRWSRFFGRFFFAFGWFMIGMNTGGAAQESQPWSLVLSRYGAAVVPAEGAIYVLGGANSLGAMSSIEKIDLETGVSTLLPARLIGRRFHAAVLLRREIHVFGGDAREGLISTVQAFSLDTGKVRKVGRMPTPRRALSAVQVDGLAFTLGGSAPGDLENLPRSPVVEVYDPEKNEWLNAPPMLDGKEVPTVLHGHYLYQLGGYNGTGRPETSCQRYDLRTGEWSQLPPAPFSLSAYSAVSIGDAIVCFGDFTQLGRVAAYRPSDASWRVLDIPFVPRRHSAACVINDWVYVVGGNTDTRPLGAFVDKVDRYRVSDLREAIARTVR